MAVNRQERTLEIFYRAMRGEALSVRTLANEYGVSAKSITRNLNDLKFFLAEHRDLVGNTDLEYNYHERAYRLRMEEFLSNKELFTVVKIILGVRALSKLEVLELIAKLKRFTTTEDRAKLDEIIRREVYHYNEVHHDCESMQENLWRLVNLIDRQKEITLHYYKLDHSYVERRVRPVSLMFSEYYFYLIAFIIDDKARRPIYFRVDRITEIVEHRKIHPLKDVSPYDEGALRERIQLMWPGKLQVIRFEYSGPSVQAILDKLPTARILERLEGRYLLEAEVFGIGIKMFLLSQGQWIKVTSPTEFVQEMKDEIDGMMKMYE